MIKKMPMVALIVLVQVRASRSASVSSYEGFHVYMMKDAHWCTHRVSTVCQLKFLIASPCRPGSNRFRLHPVPVGCCSHRFLYLFLFQSVSVPVSLLIRPVSILLHSVPMLRPRSHSIAFWLIAWFRVLVTLDEN